MLENDPAKNLSAPLQHAADSYETKRELFFQTLSEASIQHVSSGYSTAAKDGGQSHLQMPFEMSNDTQVQYTLTNPVAQLLQMAGCECSKGSVLSNMSLQRLNKLVTSSKIIWNLGRLAVLHLAPEIVVKVGANLDLDHVGIVDYIKHQAPIVPVPAILGVIQSGRTGYIFMEYVRGRALDSIWTSLRQTQKDDIKAQLYTIFASLRAIKPSQTNRPVAFGAGTPPRCKDVRRELRRATTLIKSETEFNDFLLSSVESDPQQDCSRSLIRQYLRSDHDVFLTHADLHPRNIMVEEQDQPDSEKRLIITGIIDWELGGWYPSYWEYVKALHTTGPGSEFSDWWRYLPTDAIGVRGPEHAIDLMISRWLS